MAASQSLVTEQALLDKKLEENLTCAICISHFRDPKQLQCFHVYCKECLQLLMPQDHQGQVSICCPTCRQLTPLPPGGVPGLQSAIHVNQMREIKETLQKLKDSRIVPCDKCTKTYRTATNFCRDCGKFICKMCTTMHNEWEEFFNHELVTIGEVWNDMRRLKSTKKVTLKCSLHQGKELELYCETCEELICHNCTVSRHCRPQHNYDLVSDSFERHRAELVARLEPIIGLHTTTRDALEQLDLRSREFDDQEARIEANLRQQVQQIYDLLQAKQAELTDHLKEYMQSKRKNLAVQKEKVEFILAKLNSCVSFVEHSLNTDSQGEVMKIKMMATMQSTPYRHLQSNRTETSIIRIPRPRTRTTRLPLECCSG